MNKEAFISFRCDEAVQQGLEKLAREERRSISSTIEIILYKYLNNKKLLPSEDHSPPIQKKTAGKGAVNKTARGIAGKTGSLH